MSNDTNEQGITNQEEIFESESEASHDSYYQTEDNDFINELSTITPSVYLPLVPVLTDEEKYDLLYKCRAKAFRFRGDEWKERATGELKILRDKGNYRIRVILRQDQTKKAMVNFFIEDDPLCEIKSYLESEKMIALTVRDFSDSQSGNLERLVFKFSNPESKVLLII
jgi:hypothetical protein